MLKYILIKNTFLNNRKVIQNLGELPNFINFLIKRFIEKKIIHSTEQEYPNMCIINEYQAGQGN